MPSIETTRKIVLGLTCAYVLVVLLLGYFVIQQILLSVLIALLGVIVYLVWRLIWGAGPGNGDGSVDTT